MFFTFASFTWLKTVAWKMEEKAPIMNKNARQHIATRREYKTIFCFKVRAAALFFKRSSSRSTWQKEKGDQGSPEHTHSERIIQNIPLNLKLWWILLSRTDPPWPVGGSGCISASVWWLGLPSSRSPSSWTQSCCSRPQHCLPLPQPLELPSPCCVWVGKM